MKTLLALGMTLTLGCASKAPPPASPEPPATETTPEPTPTPTTMGSWWCFTDDIIMVQECWIEQGACEDVALQFDQSCVSFPDAWCADIVYADGQADEACSASEAACEDLIEAMREIDGTEGGPCTLAP